MKPAPFRYEAPRELGEVHALLSEHGDEAKVLAGGQSLGPLLNLRMSTPSVLVDLAHVAELRQRPRLEGGRVRIPAMTTYRTVLDDPVVRASAPLLVEAVAFVGHEAIRNAGTVGGSVAHADPAAEVPTCLVALDARIGLSGPAGERVVHAHEFFTGTFTTVLAPDEVVAWVEVPRAAPGSGTAWLEVAPRHGDYAVVGVAAVVDLASDRVVRTKVCLSSVSDRPNLVDLSDRLDGHVTPQGRTGSRAPGIEGLPEALRDSVREVAAGLRLQDDLVASARYKGHLVETLTVRALAVAIQRAAGEEGSVNDERAT